MFGSEAFCWIIFFARAPISPRSSCVMSVKQPKQTVSSVADGGENGVENAFVQAEALQSNA